MFQVQNLTNDPKQKQALVLPDGTVIALSIAFIEMQLGWFITNLTYGDFVLSGVRITNSPDMLYQFRNRLPFGLACVSDQQREPMLRDDFSSGASKLYVLTAEEVAQFSGWLSG